MYEVFVKVATKQKLVFKFILNEDTWRINESFKDEFDEHGNRNNYVEANELIPYDEGSELIETCDEPIGTCDEPIGTCDEPIETSNEPIETSNEPIETSNEPIGTSDEAIGTSDEAIEVSDEPIEVSDEPIEVSVEPETSTEPFEASNEPIEASVEPETLPDPIEASTDPIETSTDPIEASVEPETLPDPIEASTDPIETSTDPIEASVEPETSSDPIETSADPFVNGHPIDQNYPSERDRQNSSEYDQNGIDVGKKPPLNQVANVTDSEQKISMEDSSDETDQSSLNGQDDEVLVISPISYVASTKESWHGADDINSKENMEYLSPTESSFTELSFVTSDTKLQSPHYGISQNEVQKQEDSFDSTADETQSSVNTTRVLGIIEGTGGANNRLGELTISSQKPRRSSGFFGRLSSFFRS